MIYKEKILLEQFFNQIISYIESNDESNQYIEKYLEVEELKEKINLKLSDQPDKDFLLLISDYLKYSVRTGNKNFMNQLFGGFLLPGFISEVLIAATNTSMYTYEVAPIATLIEKEMIYELSKMVGYKNVEGTFVTGGSNANLISILCAIYNHDKKNKHQGIISREKEYVIFISDQAHYSYKKAAVITGLGLDAIIKVKTDSNGCMIPEDLQSKIIQQKDKLPLYVGLTAGTTVRGAFDPIQPIAKICQKYNLWMHIDASWGGGLLFSDDKDKYFTGSQHADSFSLDGHKMLGVPLICSMILFKNKNILYEVNDVSGIDYLFHDEQEVSFNLGNFSLQCGRRVEATKMWLVWKYLGYLGIKKRINHLLDIAKKYEEIINEQDDIELVAPIQSLNICFRYIPRQGLSDISLNQLNQKIRNHMMKTGEYLVNTAMVDNKRCIRQIVVNPDLNKNDIQKFINTIQTVGKNQIAFLNESK